MRKQYNFVDSVRNPYATYFRKQVGDKEPMLMMAILAKGEAEARDGKGIPLKKAMGQLARRLRWRKST